MNDLLLLKPKTAAKYDQIQCDHTLTEILKPPICLTTSQLVHNNAPSNVSYIHTHDI